MDISFMERIPQESTREYVFRCLKENIMHLRLAPGSILSEKDIAVLLNVSKTPVREAFIQLSKEYLLDILPQKGTYVSLLDLEKVDESIFLRETVEREVIKLACTDFPAAKLFELQSCIALQQLCLEEENYIKFFELDEKLHKGIFDGCKKARIWSLIQQINTHYNRIRILDLDVGGKRDWSDLLKQHQDLILAIKEKNVTLGTQTINLHLNRVKITINNLRVDYAHYFKQNELD